jgi:DNA-directed RNA polymerase specialized sigma24 family protein
MGLTSLSYFEKTCRAFEQFREGSEKGLEFFYRQLQPNLYHRGLRYIKDDINADGIVKEAFIRLWLSRRNISSPEQLCGFVTQLAVDGFKAYFRSSKFRFERDIFRLDDIENYQEFIGDNDTQFDIEFDTMHYLPESDQNTERWQMVQAVLPKIGADQQLFIRLCLRYAFDYGRIASHLGGISDYQVANKVGKILRELKSIVADTKKLGTVKNSRFTFQGDISEEQSKILRMRYTLGYSFAEIAEELNLPQGHIQQAFAAASLKIKKIKVI